MILITPPSLLLAMLGTFVEAYATVEFSLHSWESLSLT